MVKHLLFVMLLLFTCSLSAQQARQYSFTRYNTVGGLASNFVNNIVQDDEGYIWLATVNGLQRYDGHKFLTFASHPGNRSAIPDNNVSLVCVDNDKKLWVITADNRVGIFDTRKFEYREVPVRWKQQFTLSVPKKLVQTNDGRLYLFTISQGIYIMDPVTKSFEPAGDLIKIPPGWNLNDIVPEPNTNRLWMAADSGIAVFDMLTKHLSYRGHNTDKDLVIDKLQNETRALKIAVDVNRFFFVSWPAGSGSPRLNFINRKTLSVKNFNLSSDLNLGYHEILGSLHQQNSRIWFYGRPFIVEFVNDSNPFRVVRNEYKNEQSIKFDAVNSMYEDREKNIWISTDNGLFLFNPDAQAFNSYNVLRPSSPEPREGPVQVALQLKNGNVWIGCWSLGLFCYDESLNPIKVPQSLEKVKNSWSIWCMWEHSRSGKIWIGLQGGIMIVYDPSTGKAEFFEPAIFQGSTIRQMTEDNQGNLWFGSHGGHIIRWDATLAGGDVKRGYSLFKKGGLVHKMFTGTDGSVWVATLGMGLDRINPQTNTVNTVTTSSPEGRRLSANSPYDIMQYNDSLVLIANGAIDMLNTRTGAVSTINTEDGLPSNNVLCLQKDQNGLVWLGMINGLCRMNLQEKIFINYDRRDGISTDNFNLAGAFQLADKRMVFTTEHDFLVFQPAAMVQKDPPPDARVISFKMANRSLLVDSLNNLKKVTLEYNKNSITIGFGTLSYLRNNKKLFYYRLQNLEEDWILADDRHEAIYNHIPPGNYRFQVKTVNGFGITSSHITTMLITVKAPFWKTWWFYGLLLLAAILILYWIDRERIRRLTTLQQVRTQIAASLHQDITTTLNNIHLLSEIAKIKADKDITKSKEYIDQINNKSRRMIDDMDDMLWSIDPQNDSMQKTLERMNEFTDGLKNTHSCLIELVVDEKVKALKLDMKTRHELFFIFKEALLNIIQLSNCGESIINIDLNKSNLQIKIHDNGSGLDLKTIQNKNEVKEIYKRADMLNAEIDIQSDKKGTSFIMQVPVRLTRSRLRIDKPGK